MYVSLSNRSPTRLRLYRAALATVLFAVANFAWANNAGKAIFVLGEVKAFDATRAERKLAKGDELHTGDSIVTSHKGQAHIQMSDGGMIAIRPNSEFRIDDYRFDGNATTDKSMFSLLKGGFRSVTGAIGHANKAAYGVKTPVATIGIRGTDYVARLCASDCGNDGNDGLYVTVLSGGIAVANASGSLDVSPGQFGFTPANGELPTLLPAAPSAGLFASTSVSTTSNTLTAATTAVTVPDSALQMQSIVNTLGVNSIALPTEGSYTYAFSNPVMNPTSATLSGSSSMTADFAKMEISGVVLVNNGLDSWNGTTKIMSINNTNNTFGGDFASVTASLDGASVVGTSGQLSGNLAGPVIAGTSNVRSGSVDFGMSADTGTSIVSVSGSATLQ